MAPPACSALLILRALLEPCSEEHPEGWACSHHPLPAQTRAPTIPAPSSRTPLPEGRELPGTLWALCLMWVRPTAAGACKPRTEPAGCGPAGRSEGAGRGWGAGSRVRGSGERGAGQRQQPRRERCRLPRRRPVKAGRGGRRTGRISAVTSRGWRQCRSAAVRWCSRSGAWPAGTRSGRRMLGYTRPGEPKIDGGGSPAWEQEGSRPAPAASLRWGKMGDS